jgi:hypothetical protein
MMIHQQGPGLLQMVVPSGRIWNVPGTRAVVSFHGGEAMTLVPVMWSVWGALVVIMAALHVYRSSLTRDEEDQIFLDDSFDHERAAQSAIVAKVNKLEPLLRVAQWLVVAMTAVVLIYYVRDILVHLGVLGG